MDRQDEAHRRRRRFAMTRQRRWTADLSSGLNILRFEKIFQNFFYKNS
jgi:hypothetical protein